MKRISALVLAALLILASSVSFAADGTSNIYQGYTFDFFGNIKSTPSPFVLSQVFDENLLTPAASKTSTFVLQEITDVCTSADGRIFIAATIQVTTKGNKDKNEQDKVESYSRIYILNADGSAYEPVDKNGTPIKVTVPLYNMRQPHSDPEKMAKGQTVAAAFTAEGAQASSRLGTVDGMFYHEKAQELYIADTTNERILVLDGKTLLVKRAIFKPSNMTGDTANSFKPYKLAVDNADRIYVVVEGSKDGIIELNEDGSFSRYFGVNEKTINLLDHFWNSIASDVQKESISKNYASPFSNVTLDGEGFIMAVTTDLSASKPVFRLNFDGANVLREMGNTPVVGDLGAENQSTFVDIAVTPYGTYAVLDSSKGRVFIYNFDGELLSVFGTMGNASGQFKTPTGIAWLGNKLIISDSGLKRVYVYEPTDFGLALLNASEAYYNGKWDIATTHFEKVLQLCGNLETAYTGIGKNLLMKEEYEEAMHYFKLGNSREFYSKAYKGHRTIVMKENFHVIAVVAIGAVLWSEVAYHRKQRRLYK